MTHTPTSPNNTPEPSAPLQAVLFDMDGVVTDTASAHAAAWRQLFDEFLRAHAEAHDDEFVAFDLEREYRLHVDGKPREDGVRDFLASRGITLPEGGPDDAPDAHTVEALARRKNRHFLAWLEANRVTAFPGTRAFITALRAAGVRTAVFSASRNAEAVLRSARALELFDTRVDGEDAARLGLRGKPDPALLREAAARLGLEVAHCAIVEDAIAGVQAGAAGGFGLVVGVDRRGQGLPGGSSHGTALREAGAQFIVHDLAELALHAGAPSSVSLSVKTLANLPSAWADDAALLKARLASRQPVVFLDYDGTLTPIVTDHTQAFLAERMRETVRRLAEQCTVAIVSGRDLAMLKRLVELDTVWFAGSHGFEIAPPKGGGERMERGTEFLPELARAERQLQEQLSGIEGHAVERKRFSIAVHYRQVADADLAGLEGQVRAVLADCGKLKLGHGKKVFELQPALDWHKGEAVLWLLERLGLAHEGVLPIYVGDDITDENAFRALAGRGLGVVVRDGSARTTAADLALDDVDGVRRLLDRLAAPPSDGLGQGAG